MATSTIIVSGLPGAGKTTRAREIAVAGKCRVISLDDYRYSDSNWTKAPYDLFKHRVLVELEHVDNGKSGLVVIESSYHDPHDPEDD